MSEQELWSIAARFRSWVTTEINRLGQAERHGLRGDYLFFIDGEPHFVLVVEPNGAWSGEIAIQPQLNIVLDGECPIQYTEETLKSLLDGAARATILTDSQTLLRLLTGTIRASAAFVSGKVQIRGDLAAFMRLVSHLKRQGVGPFNQG